jgi:hypothetical protein
MHKRVFTFPDFYEAALERELVRLGYSLAAPQKLAKAVLQLSDHYLAKPEAATPWNEPWARAASLAYYFPLNYARNRAVALEATRLGFFQGLEKLLDLGCGMGSGVLAFLDAATFAKAEAHDVSQEAVDLCNQLHQSRSPLTTQVEAIDLRRPASGFNGSTTMLLASYVFTELPEAPSWWAHAEAIAVVEPSTHQDARRLQEYRQSLIDAGFQIWAPCTHMQNCPLLLHSKKDWCHDRILWNPPAWFTAIEKDLPMKNRSLTFSYLLARKSVAPPADLSKYARLIGDTLEEKGKNRQAFCRSSDREFLAWFPQRLKKGSSIELERGNLVELSGDLEQRATELRLPSPEKIRELSTTTPLKSF